jgi:putative ABC transport system substrate-binding protein
MSHFQRRRFLAVTGARLVGLLGVSSLATPLSCLAQAQSRAPRVGFLIPGSANSPYFQEFVRGMRALGYVDGKNIVIEFRYADGKLDRLPTLADELLKLKIDILVAASTQGVRTAKRASGVIPIVMVGVGDPVGSGLVASLSRPGGNITGHSVLTEDTAPKLLEFVRDAIPGASRITAMVNSGNQNHRLALKNIQKAAEQLNMSVSVAAVRAATELEGVFAAAAHQRQDAVVVPADPLFNVQAHEIANYALRHRLPTAFTQSDNVDAGGLLSYGVSIADSFRRGAAYVDKIIKGAKPGELPVEQATLFETVVNLRTAKALGLKIPPSMLLRADRVIE